MTRNADRNADQAIATRFRRFCLSLPDAHEVHFGHGPTYRITNKIFAMDREHDGRMSFYCKVPKGSQPLMIEQDPDRFFYPPYVGIKGWIGAYLDGLHWTEADWTEIEALVKRSYQLVAPKKYAAKLT